MHKQSEQTNYLLSSCTFSSWDRGVCLGTRSCSVILTINSSSLKISIRYPLCSKCDNIWVEEELDERQDGTKLRTEKKNSRGGHGPQDHLVHARGSEQEHFNTSATKNHPYPVVCAHAMPVYIYCMILLVQTRTSANTTTSAKKNTHSHRHTHKHKHNRKRKHTHTHTHWHTHIH